MAVTFKSQTYGRPTNVDALRKHAGELVVLVPDVIPAVGTILPVSTFRRPARTD